MKKSFFFSQSDKHTCADPQKTAKCAESWMVDCGQLQDSKFQNYGCQLENSKNRDFFACANRNDKADILFKNPPVPREKTFQAVNYNEVLSFTERGFSCGQQEIFWADFKTKSRSHGSEKCLLKNGENDTLNKLWVYLKMDYSFKMVPILTAL